MANTVSISALRPEVWQKALYKDVMDGLFFNQNKLMGKDENNIIQVKDELKKGQGDTVTFGLTTKLSGDGVTGDSELESNEEKITAYSESVLIDQIRNAVALTGRLDEQKNAYDMRSDAKAKLATWGQELIERQIFMKLAGVTTTTLTDVNGDIYSGNATWSNTATGATSAEEAAGTGVRYICADSDGLDSLAATDVMSTTLISRAKILAKLASPKIRPLRVDGKDHYVMFLHPWQVYDLKKETVFQNAQRDAQTRGASNPLFTGAIGVWDGVILYEHEYVPTCDAAATFTVSGTGAGAQAFRSVLCGKQAIATAFSESSFRMVEKSFDYGNQVRYATGIIGGIQKPVFNSKDYGVVMIDTGATAL